MNHRRSLIENSTFVGSLLVLSFVLAACGSVAVSPGAESTKAVAENLTPTPELTDLPTTVPAEKSPVSATLLIDTPMASPTPAPTSAVESQAACVCSVGQVFRTISSYQALYFRTFEGDWHRTTEQFMTTEWVAPAGALSPDLQTLVVFDCDGPGSICVAAPPQSTPMPLPFHYQLPESANSHFVHWLPDNQRLLFMSEYSRPGQDVMDFRLYLLDLQIPELFQLTDRMEPDSDWAVSPLGTCVAYSAYDKETGSARFRLTNVESNNFHSWLPETQYSHEWPGLGDSVDWSPDGSRLAFSGESSIVVWDLTTNERMEYGKESQIAPFVLKWSPDGNKIYFVAPGSNTGMSHWVLDLITGAFKELAETSALSRSHAYLWLPNSEEIIVPGVFGSSVLSISDGSTREVSYPGSTDWQEIADMFFGPISP